MTHGTYDNLWQSGEVVSRIASGIESNRKSDVALRVARADGRPAAGVRVDVEQLGAAFLFGGNIFMLGGYAEPEMNARYERAFVELFNAATVPLYWRDLEPAPGRLCFAADSEAIPRRPPVDTVVALCEQHGLNMNGHPLLWDVTRFSVPDWLPTDPERSLAMWEKRFRAIGDRYGGRIHRWDVVNEPTGSRERCREGVSRPMPAGYERLAFAWAQRWFPRDALLMINDDTGAWSQNLGAYVELIRRLLDDGAAVRGVGIQFHVFSDGEFRRMLAGEVPHPMPLLEALDALGQFWFPVHISEITLPALDNDGPGQAAQARVAQDLYGLWFSHPAVHAITWWNVPDGGGPAGGAKVERGLLTRELKPKPAYHALHELIHNQWRTNVSVTTDANGEARLRAFHGPYRVTCDAVTDELDVMPGQANEICIRRGA